HLAIKGDVVTIASDESISPYAYEGARGWLRSRRDLAFKGGGALGFCVLAVALLVLGQRLKTKRHVEEAYHDLATAISGGDDAAIGHSASSFLSVSDGEGEGEGTARRGALDAWQDALYRQL